VNLFLTGRPNMDVRAGLASGAGLRNAARNRDSPPGSQDLPQRLSCVKPEYKITMRKGSVKPWYRANMRFVPIKAIEQQDLQGLHRIRQSVVKPRTVLANQIRGRLGE
jgi:hypothetical protein